MSARVPHANPTRRLPEQPNLEQLRKQAKDLLESYRAGERAAVEEVQQFEHDAQSASFALHDAQLVLARAYGYESWPKLKAFVDGVNVKELAEAVKCGDVSRVRVLLNARPELVGMDMSENNEHRALHYAVLERNPRMVQLLMEAGADARKGIWPHRDATTALAIARDRGYDEIVAVIEEEERRRREEMSCPNATISPVQEQINAAIATGDNETAIRLLVADGSLIQACDREGATPLHIAAEEGNEEMVRWLLDRRANVRKEDIHGWTALDRAALAADPRNEIARTYPAIAKLLLARGAELTFRGAIALGDAQRVRELVERDRSLLSQIQTNGGPLTLAVNHDRIEMVRLLLDLGADVDERMLLGQVETPTVTWGMPLWYAALGNQLAIVQLLLDRGADPNANVYASGWPLRNAWNHKDGRVKQLLLARGAKPQPYMVSETHDVAEAKRLLETEPSEKLAQELAWSAADHGCPAILELALPHLTWARDDRQWHWILIQPIRGASGDSSKNEGYFASMDILLRHGVDPNITRLGQAPLHFAAAYSGPVSDQDRARFAEQLLDAGARLDLRDDLLKSTPLGWACRWGRRKLAEVLIAHGADTEEKSSEPWATPKAWAGKMGRKEILEVLN